MARYRGSQEGLNSSVVKLTCIGLRYRTAETVPHDKIFTSHPPSCDIELASISEAFVNAKLSMVKLFWIYRRIIIYIVITQSRYSKCLTATCPYSNIVTKLHDYTDFRRYVDVEILIASDPYATIA